MMWLFGDSLFWAKISISRRNIWRCWGRKERLEGMSSDNHGNVGVVEGVRRAFSWEGGSKERERERQVTVDEVTGESKWKSKWRMIRESVGLGAIITGFFPSAEGGGLSGHMRYILEVWFGRIWKAVFFHSSFKLLDTFFWHGRKFLCTPPLLVL